MTEVGRWGFEGCPGRGIGPGLAMPPAVVNDDTQQHHGLDALRGRGCSGAVILGDHEAITSAQAPFSQPGFVVSETVVPSGGMPMGREAADFVKGLTTSAEWMMGGALASWRDGVGLDNLQPIGDRSDLTAGLEVSA